MSEVVISRGALIIVEGPDACGKSYVSRAIADIHDFFRWHMTWTEELGVGFNDYSWSCWNNIKEALERGQDVVMDRFWPSELLYGTVYRNGPMTNVAALAEECSAYGATYVYCRSDNVMSRFNRTKQPPWLIDRFREVVSAYEGWWSSFHDAIERKAAIVYNVDAFEMNDRFFFEEAVNIMVECSRYQSKEAQACL